MSLKNTSKYISLILRHKPETIGITLDEHGWANVAELIEGVNRTHPLTMDVLEEIVSTDEKQRYSFNEDKTLIRANQGHSVAVDVELEAVKPPKYLYHGTGEKYVSSIDTQGLIPNPGYTFIFPEILKLLSKLDLATENLLCIGFWRNACQMPGWLSINLSMVFG